MYTNMKLMFVCPAEFLLLTNQAHARADRANNCGQVQNMTIRQQEPPQDFKLELNRCQGQSLSQLLSCQSRARAMPCTTCTRAFLSPLPVCLRTEQWWGVTSLSFKFAQRSGPSLQGAAPGCRRRSGLQLPRRPVTKPPV